MTSQEGRWKWTRTAALFVIIAAIPLSAWYLIGNNLFLQWLITLALLSIFTFVAGQGVTGRWVGALIDDRNVISLSRFQMLVWTILILAAYLTATLFNIYANQSNPLGVALPRELWLLMGISTTSLVGSPLILSTKAMKAPSEAEMKNTFELLAQQGDASGTLTAKGQIVANRDVASARWSDMFTGEEVGNAAHLDLSRIQMFFFTLITALAYAVALGHIFINHPGGAVSGLPALDQSMLALIAISHGGYLTSKAVPHSQPKTEGTGSGGQQSAMNDHPAMG